MRKWICILAIALITGCGSGNVDGQFQGDLEQSLQGSGLVESVQVIHPDSPSLEELKAALEVELNKLGVDPNRAVSSAPSGKGIDASYFDVYYDFSDEIQIDSVVLSWAEQFAGDCDFNGEVNLSDLQPLVLYWNQAAEYRSFVSSNGVDGYPNSNPQFNETRPDEAKNWVLGQIDSDNNGEINLADISGIAQHFQQSIAGFNIYRRKAGEDTFSRLPHPNNPGSPLTVLREEATQPGTANPELARPPMYLFNDPDVTPGMREYYVVPADQNGIEGTGNPVVRRRFLHDNLGELPYATFNVNDKSNIRFFEPGTQIEVNHSESRARNPGTVILEYGYDIDGDDLFDYVSHDLAPVLITLQKPGLSHIRLRVTDNNGYMGFYETPVFVGTNNPGVLNMQVDYGDGFVPSIITYDSVGTYDPDGIADITFLFGNVADPGNKNPISYLTIHDTGDYFIEMVVTDSFGVESSIEQSFSMLEGGYINPGWRFNVISEDQQSQVYTPDFVAQNIAGKPAIAINGGESEANGLHYRQALDVAGSEWGPYVLVDGNGFLSQDSQIKDVNGVPALAYLNFRSIRDMSAMYSHALTADGIDWIEPIEVTRGFLVMPILGMSSGKPAIAVGGYTMGVSQALDPLGDSWGENQEVDDYSGIPNDWLNINGQEVIIVHSRQLATRPQDSNDPWGEPILLPEELSYGLNCWAVCEGLLTFWNIDSSYPYQVRQFQAQANDARIWSEPLEIELHTKSTNSEIDVLVIEGSPPWLCYYNYTRFELQIMQATDLQASSWGEPEVVTSYGDVGKSCKLVEVNGQPGIVYRDISNNKLMLAVKE